MIRARSQQLQKKISDRASTPARDVREAIAEAFNEQWPIGTSVVLIEDDGRKLETRTRSEAWALSDAVIVKVEGKSGGYDLARIVPHPRAVARTETSSEWLDRVCTCDSPRTPDPDCPLHGNPRQLTDVHGVISEG